MNNKSIIDAEMDSFFELDDKRAMVGRIYADKVIKLEEEILQTAHGKRIRAFEKLGIGLNLEDIIEKYIEISGIQTDEVGNVVLEQQTLNEVYQENLGVISKQLGYDVSALNIQQLNKVINRVDHASRIEEFGKIEQANISEIEKDKKIPIEIIMDIKFNELSELRNSLGIKNDGSIMRTNDLRNLLLATIGPQEVVDKYIEKYENDTINTFLENEADVNIIENLVRLQNRINSGEKIDESVEQEEFINNLELYKDSKYFSEICDESGKFNLHKALDFYEKFKKVRNENDISTKTNEFLKKDELTEEDHRDFATLLLRLTKSSDEVTIRNAINVAKNFGIDVLDKNENLDTSKVENLCRDTFCKNADMKLMLEWADFTDKSALFQLDRIRNSIKRDVLEAPKNADEVNQYKENAKKKEKRLCNKKEAAIFKVLDSPNALNIKHNYYANEENAKQLILLFCTFRQEEIVANKKMSKDEHNFNAMSINTGRDPTANSAIVQRYIMQNRQYFESYLNEYGGFDVDKVMQLVEEHKLDINRTANQMIAYEQIKKRTDKIEEEEVEYKNKIKLINNKIVDARESQNGDIDIDEIFEAAKGIPAELLTTETLEFLKNADEKRFHKIFDVDKAVHTVGQNSWGSIYFSAAKFFVKGAALTKMILDKEARKKYMTNIKKTVGEVLSKKEDNKEGENKTSSNKRKGFFSKIFKKDKTELLPEGSDVQKEENNSEHWNKNQQAFDINEKHHVDHFKSLQETEEAKKVKESRQQELDESESDRNV